MSLRTHSSVFTAFLIVGICAVFPRAYAGQQKAEQPTRTALDVITVTGCVQREADYRAAIANGKGGALGTGAGVSNEYVLRSVETVSNDTLQPTGTSARGVEEVYTVTGNLERELGKAVGQEVAVSGYVEVAKSGGTEKVKDLPNFKVIGWHSVANSCPTPVRTR